MKVVKKRTILAVLACCLLYFLYGNTPGYDKRGIRHVPISAYPSEACYQKASECVPQTELARMYGGDIEAIKSYDQKKCCKYHPLVRRAVEFAIFTMKLKRGIPLVLESGSALGILRHQNRQIPWTPDGDVTALLDYADSNFTLSNFEEVLMSINKVPEFKGKFAIVKRKEFSFCLMVDGWNALDIFLFHFVPAPPGAEKYIQVAQPGWKAVRPPKPLSMVFPGANCKFYNKILPKGCPSKLKEYIVHSYGSQALRGPTEFSYGPNAGYDDKKKHLIILRKRAEIVFFFKAWFVWALLIIVVQRRCGGKSTQTSKVCQILLFAVVLPLLLAIAWAMYLSKTEPFMLNVNYGTVLATIFF
jgi:hypothetical protein